MKILLIEDDSATAAYIEGGLKEHGHVVDRATDGRDGLFLATADPYDVLIVDRMLPQLDGLAVIGTLRAVGKTTPVLILSALDEVDERIRGLRAGGDDYMTKPFAFGELLARVEALLRRASPVQAETVLRVADLEMDVSTRSVRRDGRSIALQPQEFRLLEFLMRHAGKVVSRTMLFEHVWDYHFDPRTNVIEVQIGRLRKKIDRGFERPLLQTIRGAGYSLREAD